MRKCQTEDCLGYIEIRDVYEFKGHCMAQKMQCTHCLQSYKLQPKKKDRLEKNIELFHRLTTGGYNTWASEPPAYWKTIDEAVTQHILGIIYPDHKIICCDIDGSLRNQFDFLITSPKNTIALDVTQATNQYMIPLHLVDENNNLKNKRNSHSLQYDWVITYNENADVSSDSIKRLESLLSSLEINNKCSEGQLLKLEFKNNNQQCRTINSLIAGGYINGHAFLSGKEYGSIEFIGPFTTHGSLDPISLLKIAHEKTNADDNKKKMSLATTTEKHLFIPITGYHSNAACVIHQLPKSTYEYRKEGFFDELPFSQILGNIFDVVWLSTIFNFNKEGKIGFQLAKISNQQNHITLEILTADQVLYFTKLYA